MRSVEPGIYKLLFISNLLGEPLILEHYIIAGHRGVRVPVGHGVGAGQAGRHRAGWPQDQAERGGEEVSLQVR